MVVLSNICEPKNISVFRKVADHIANGDSIEDACKKEGKPKNFYFRFQAENINNEEVSNLSTRARIQKSHGYFDKCEKALKDLEEDRYEPQKARVLFDSYLRLAGKANQGLYGDKQTIEHTGSVTVMPLIEVDGEAVDFIIGENVESTRNN